MSLVRTLQSATGSQDRQQIVLIFPLTLLSVSLHFHVCVLCLALMISLHLGGSEAVMFTPYANCVHAAASRMIWEKTKRINR